jgi:hypothetical protein
VTSARSRFRISSRSIAASALALLAACSAADKTPPVATIQVRANKTRVALGSPLQLTYEFDVAQGASIPGDFHVFVHVVSPDGQQLWTDDHDPAVPTSQWKPGQKIEYTRTRFVPVVPCLCEATIVAGLYKDSERLPLQAASPADRDSTSREYKVGTLTLLPSSENIFTFYKSGWHPDEFAPDDPARSWKWTQKSAALSFKNPKTDVNLLLDYDARPDVFNGTPQQVTVLVGDQPVATFAADSISPTLKTIPITAAQLGTADMVDLRIDVDKTFVPARLPAGGKDVRELGLRIYHVFVESR